MEQTLFLGSRGRGINLDLIVLKDHLIADSDASFFYFVKSEAGISPEEKETLLANKQTAIDHCKNVICADASLKGVKLNDEEQVRLIIPGLYEYVFREALAEEKKEQKALNRFTHIFVTSPFAEEMFRQMYTKRSITLIKGFSSPAMLELGNKNARDSRKNEFYRFCPSAAQKKLLTIITSNLEAKTETLFAGFDLKRLLDRMDEEWAVCTNVKEIRQAAEKLSSSYKEKIIILPDYFWRPSALFATDFLVTNDSYYASVFAALKRPLYSMNYTDNYFEQFMRMHYPGQFLTDLNVLAKEWEERDGFAQKHKAFFDRFTYDSGQDPIPEILSLLK